MSITTLKHLANATRLMECHSLCLNTNRGIWAWLNSVFNKVDVDRVMQGGPDRACAEWLLRCGAKYRWMESETWISDYNALPLNNHPKHKIKEIDATNSCIDVDGFNHFKNCNHIEKIKLHKSHYIDDSALVKLRFLKKSLKDLEISSCGDVSKEGLMTLHHLTKLERLYLFDLPLIEDKKEIIGELLNFLPQCQIDFPE